METFWETGGCHESGNFFLEARAIGPNLPPVLYGLLQFYAAAGRADKMLEVGKTILQYWPDDQGVQKVVTALENYQTKTSAPKN